MINRRGLLTSAIAAGAALLAPPAGLRPARAASGALRFGVIADPQYADQRTKGSRFYRRTLDKLPPALDDLSGEDLSFTVTLGDIIDQYWESYEAILPLYARLRAPHFFVLGNHDYQVGAAYFDQVHKITGITATHYSFTGSGYRFIVLDGNEVTLFANPPGTEFHALAEAKIARLRQAGYDHARQRNGAISDAQFAWVEAEMNAARAAGERVIAMSHYPIYPANAYNMLDDQRLVALFSSYDNFALYICGHNHKGNYGRIGNAHFLNFKGMVETRRRTAYATVSLHDDRIEVEGRDREPSRTLEL